MTRVTVAAALAVGGAIAGCMLVPDAVARGTAHVAVAVAAIGGIIAGLAFIRAARRHTLVVGGIARVARPSALNGHSVSLVRGLDAPLVGGLRKPTIYCGDDLPDRLDPAEIDAVILHERHHQLARAPLRLVLIAALEPLMKRVVPGRSWLARERARIEIAADAFAIESGVGREALASAIVKFSTGSVSAFVPGFASAADLRIRALLGERTGLEPGASTRLRAAVAVLSILTGCLALYIA